MKNTFLIIVCCLLGLTDIFAQNENPPVVLDDVTAAVEKVVPKSTSRDRLIFELVHDNWANKPDSIQVKWWNRGFNMHIMYDIALIDDNVSFAPGIGVSTSNVYHTGYWDSDTANVTILRPINENIDYRKNKLSTTYFEIPLELRFRTNPDRMNRSLKAAVGVRGGYCLNFVQKYRGPEIGNVTNEVFIKDKLIPNANNVRLSATARVGYANFNLFATYSLTTLFNPDQGPGIHPFSVGFSFSSF